MKKKILSLFIMLCLIIPCSFLLVSCGKKESTALTVSFNLDTTKFASDVVVDAENKTISWVYNTSYNIDDSFFKIVGTDAEGNVENLAKATEETIGYKVDSTLPSNRTHVPAGSYTLKLYCDESDNGEIKFSATESTWTINVEKKTIDCADYVWSHRTEDELVYTPGQTYQVYLESSEESFADAEGVTEVIFDNTSDLSGMNAGTYTTRVNFVLDTKNYNHINVPEKTYTWSIAKANPNDYLSFEEFWGVFGNGYIVEYNPNGPVGINSQLDLDWEHLAGFGFTGNFEGTSMTTEPGTYTVTPIFTEQEDTDNWLAYDPEYYKLTWKVIPKVLNLEDVSWDYSTRFEYDGEQKEVVLTNLPDGVSVSYTNNTATAEGTYEATATITFDEKYYAVHDGTSLTYTLTWIIEPADE